jgi:dethiobiotin synthetase
MRGLFITGTDTGVGKSVLSAAVIAAMREAGEDVRAFKPVVTGLDEPPEQGDSGGVPWPPDHELLGGAAGMAPNDVSPLRFGPAVSPHLAAALAGAPIAPNTLVEAAYRATEPAQPSAPAPTLVVEGVGGLLVPLADSYAIRDLALALALPLVIAARPGLGTINHTLLTIEAARSVGLHVCAVVLTPWPADPSTMELSNRSSIASMGEVEVEVLSNVPSPMGADLAAAGRSLPWRKWIV